MAWITVVLKPFNVKDPQSQQDMHLATDPHLKMFCAREPREEKIAYVQAHSAAPSNSL